MEGLGGKNLQIKSFRFGEATVLVVLERKFESLLKCHSCHGCYPDDLWQSLFRQLKNPQSLLLMPKCPRLAP